MVLLLDENAGSMTSLMHSVNAMPSQIGTRSDVNRGFRVDGGNEKEERGSDEQDIEREEGWLTS